MCWFYIGIAQKTLDPPLCQTGTRGKKVLQTILASLSHTHPLSGNAHLEKTHFKKGLPLFRLILRKGQCGWRASHFLQLLLLSSRLCFFVFLLLSSRRHCPPFFSFLVTLSLRRHPPYLKDHQRLIQCTMGTLCSTMSLYLFLPRY